MPLSLIARFMQNRLIDSIRYVGRPIVAAAAFPGGSTGSKAGRQAGLRAPHRAVDAFCLSQATQLSGIELQLAAGFSPPCRRTAVWLLLRRLVGSGLLPGPELPLGAAQVAGTPQDARGRAIKLFPTGPTKSAHTLPTHKSETQTGSHRQPDTVSDAGNKYTRGPRTGDNASKIPATAFQSEVAH